MSRPNPLFDRESLSSIDDSGDSLEAECCPVHGRRRKELGEFQGNKGKPSVQQSRLKRNEQELAELRFEVTALKHMFVERNSAMLRLQLALEKAERMLSAATEKCDEPRKLSSRHSEHQHVSPPGEMCNSTCVFPPARSFARSPGDFSFSNKETDETSMFSFGEIDENIEVLRAYTAHYPHDSMELEEQRDAEVLLVPFIYEPRRTGCEPGKSYPILIGEHIAERYRIDAIIASTDFCTVLACYDGEKKTDVCVKVAHNEKDILDRSLRELRTWRLLESTHLSRLLDFFYYKEHLFLVSELLGENLKAVYTSPTGRQLLQADGVRDVARCVLLALESMHRSNVVHGNVKPESVLLTKPLRKMGKRPRAVEITLADFTHACPISDFPANPHSSLAYQAPEVSSGGTLSVKVDIWSLGCVLAELHLAVPLFPAASASESLRLVLSTQIRATLGRQASAESEEEVAFSQRFAGADRDFVEFLKALLRVNPAKRPSASEALQHKWLSAEPLHRD